MRIPLSAHKYRRWKDRYGKANEHNALVPRDHWIETVEREAIIRFAKEYPLEGYRRLTFMMLDRNLVAVSPSTTYRVLKEAGLLRPWNQKPSRKGQGFLQPLQPHEHWHTDFSHVNVGGTFYYLCSVLDGCSRAIVAWDIREQMQERDAEIVLQQAREAHPEAKAPRHLRPRRPVRLPRLPNLQTTFDLATPVEVEGRRRIHVEFFDAIGSNSTEHFEGFERFLDIASDGGEGLYFIDPKASDPQVYLFVMDGYDLYPTGLKLSEFLTAPRLPEEDAE